MKKSVVAVFCSFLLCAGAASYAQGAKSLVRVDNLTKSQVIKLANQGYDIPKEGEGYAEIVLDNKGISELKNAGHSIKYLIKNLDAYVSDVQKAQKSDAAYFTYETMVQQLKEWTKDYPEICRIESIGKSVENRDIWALKVSDNPELNEVEPAALIMGDHHAREWPSVEVTMASAKELLTGFGNDETMTRLVNSREVWFVPMVNPDGMVYSQTHSKMWRKNRRKVGNNYGIDPNRNYGYEWGNVGASSSPYSDTYHGEKPFSEPETRAIRDLAKRERFQGSISFHSYSQLILYPYSYTNSVPAPDEKVLKQMAIDMSKFNNYKPILSAGLYPAMGESDDYLYGELKVLAFTFELCRTFIPNYSEIPNVNAKNVPAVMYLIDKCGTLALVTPAGTDKIINSLNFTDTLSALKVSNDLFGRNDHIKTRNEVLIKIEKISKRAAEIVSADLKAGNAETWNALKVNTGADLAISYVKNRVKFDAAHGSNYCADLLSEM